MAEIQTLDLIRVENNAELISSTPPSFGDIRIKPLNSLLLPIVSDAKILYDTTRFTYFEVKLCQTLTKLFIGFGFTSSESHDDEDIVGWDTDTIGFHYDNGRVYQETSFTAPIADKLHLVDVKGDEVFGFFLDHEIGEFKVTCNGRLLHNSLGTRFTMEKYKKKIFKPMISVDCGMRVEMEINLGLQLGSRPFLFTEMVLVKQRQKLFEMQGKCSDMEIVCQE
ncbi:hypothetical protein NAEGRDRAFT_81898 [Naegleria gruberi]|uniref:B30.2/SPRY domain-containing protein n=1 Tax=Naegleria gruberi TaxID=5762 RepID=D2W067_NAEGR|nr:uncharacterized protein NAEGRDRAFT_81898 [Naegleria gruberi]EFC37519.1 hypothetical protein NAEGRDRAFT_81898 [Naegleria gruberi]|eukprot:XP_002670263.1 hypothetical protein NAEGRDRAFT_81898 [Naegleria gruberi strain NEG-M]